MAAAAKISAGVSSRRPDVAFLTHVRRFSPDGRPEDVGIYDEYERIERGGEEKKNTHFFERFLNPAVLPTSSAHDVSLGVFLKSVNY